MGGGRVGGRNATKYTVLTTWIFPRTVSFDGLWKISNQKIEKRTYRPQVMWSMKQKSSLIYGNCKR